MDPEPEDPGMATVDRELNEAIAGLRPGQKRLVLDYIRGLEESRPGLKPGTALLQFGGTIRPDVLDEMERLIEEGCERVDPDGW